MRIFISAGEPSGDLHGANLIEALQKRHPNLEIVGFGGDRMSRAGCRLLFPLVELAVMWFARVLANAHVFLSLISKTDRYFRYHRPDAVVLIDFPGFNWWVARRAHFHGIPVYYFVPPQLWGWAGWRVIKMKRWVDHVLCTLPFEVDWYQERGVFAHYVGHPFFDEVRQHPLHHSFLEEQTGKPGTIIALLPGSRTQEVQRNFPSILKSAEKIWAQNPRTRFLVACFKDHHRKMVKEMIKGTNLPLELHVGRTPEIIQLAHSCIAVSGSVSLELLFRGKPTVILYRIGKLDLKVGNYFKTSKYITLVNLLANRELFPEFLVDHCPAQALANQVLQWLSDDNKYQVLQGELLKLRDQVGQPGACQRVADYLLNTLKEEGISSPGNNQLDAA